jgi:putative restriction endonuclease
MSTGKRSSDSLKPGIVYTRLQLSELFDTRDATIRTGIFQPKGYDSVWLFVTEDKPPDRTPYVDRLEGDTLYWQGQTAGRRDHLIIDHRQLGLELLVFHRRNRYEHDGAGFRYEGRFIYVEHSGTKPASFVLRRAPG